MKWEDLTAGDIVIYDYKTAENNTDLCIGKILLDKDTDNTILRDIFTTGCDGTSGKYADTLLIENVIDNTSFTLLSKLDEKDILASITKKYPEYFI